MVALSKLADDVRSAHRLGSVNTSQITELQYRIEKLDRTLHVATREARGAPALGCLFTSVYITMCVRKMLVVDVLDLASCS